MKSTISESTMQRIGSRPYVGAIAVLVLMAAYLAEGILGLAWILKVLEIASVFDRWLPNTSAGTLLLAAAIAWAIQLGLSRAIDAMTPTAMY
jgi:hypothetical protein